MADEIVRKLDYDDDLEMFTRLLGTWVPFALIFASTLLTGRHTTPDSATAEPAPRATRVAA